MTSLPPRLGAGATRVAVAAAAVATTSVATAAAVAGASLRTAETTTAAVASALGGTAEATAETTATAAAAAAELAEITVGIAATTAAAAGSAATTATAEGRLAGNSLEEGRNLLVGLLQEIHKLPNDAPVSTVEKGSCDTRVTSTTSTTNTVNVVVNVGGEIVVDDVGDVGDIKTTGGNSSSHHDGAATVAEELQGTLTLALGAVSVDRCGGEVLVDEEVGERISHALGLDEDERQAAGMSVEDVEEDRALVNVLDKLDLLRDVLGGRTNAADGKEDVVLEEVAGEHLDVAGEGGREHESLAVGDHGHVLTLDNAANLGLETHVKHAVSLVEDEVLDVAEGDAASLYEVHQSAGGSNKKIAAALDLAELGANIGTTVDDARADPGAVGKLAGLIVDLRNQLAGGGQNQRGGVGLALATKLASSAGRDSRRTVEEGLREDGEEETTGLARTSLGTGHEVAAAHHDGDGVLLDRSGHLVVSQLDVAAQVLVQRGGGELVDRLRDIVAGSLNGDVVVLLEVDTGVLLRRVVRGAEELALDAGVSRARDVLAVAPLSVARATGRAAVTLVATAARVASAATTPAAAAVAALESRGGVSAVAPVAAALTATVSRGGLAVRLSVH